MAKESIFSGNRYLQNMIIIAANYAECGKNIYVFRILILFLPSLKTEKESIFEKYRCYHLYNIDSG